MPTIQSYLVRFTPPDSHPLYLAPRGVTRDAAAARRFDHRPVRPDLAMTGLTAERQAWCLATAAASRVLARPTPELFDSVSPDWNVARETLRTPSIVLATIATEVTVTVQSVATEPAQ